MRYIDTSSIIVPANWTVLAQQQAFNPLWSFFKQSFEALAKKKCWYSESDNSGSVNPIDHFRPQGNTVRKLTPKNADLHKSIWRQMDSNARSGYSFLVNTFSNYRYSCDFTNSLNRDPVSKKAKGKSNFFPLQRGSAHATNLANLNTEITSLLDPCINQDPSFLNFKTAGLIEPHYKARTGSWNYCRVKISIEVYHLNYYLFVEKRSELWNDCKDIISLADVLYRKKNKSMEENSNLAHHIATLLKKIDKKSQFSAVAIDCIREHRIKMRWLSLYFPPHVLVK